MCIDKDRKNEVTRRDFARTTAAAGAGVLLSGRLARSASDATNKKRYAIVGVGVRSYMFQDAIHQTFAEKAELVGCCDVNPGRLRLAQDYARKLGGAEPPAFDARDFDRMIAETKPDVVIVTTVDGYHHEYICRSMELGADVITEKPMTVDADKCQRIIDTQRKTGRKCTVTFNYRYSPARTQVKDLLMSGVIGEVLSMDFHWMLNTHHGADYFRRWHSQKRFSGGLMVHKATHHFDLVNWWLSAIPVTVHATGKREFYTPQTAKRFGLSGPHERCHTCPEKSLCGFEMDLAANANLKRLYLDNEKYDGYHRDRCVFRSDTDIEDTMNVLVTYDNNVTLCYSVNAFNSWEGYQIVFNGTKGRIEHKVEEQIYVSGDGSVQGAIADGALYIRVCPLRDPAYPIDVWKGEGGHGGGDVVMLRDLLDSESEPDKYLRAADQRAGAYSILTGVAANRCFETGQPVRIADLVRDLGYPDYPAMPSRDEMLPMPKRRTAKLGQPSMDSSARRG
ncbi:MAG: Gfo/Idh/MocA family oxidoreductase [Vicinamibacteria bacterium]|nr:Gfo/Idh/MocA family oxidoreductase [Vicinamibacteria bacterium]